jgi:hypothetical protein
MEGLRRQRFKTSSLSKKRPEVIPALDKLAPYLDTGESRFLTSTLPILDARFRGHDVVGEDNNELK